MAYAPAVLAHRLTSRSRTATVVAVVAVAALTALAAQWRIPLPFTPVPITGSTFAVLLGGAALGWRAGAGAQALYLAVGAAGLPVFTGGGSGPDTLLGATGGYLVGFVFAAAVVGALAERRHDRTFSTMVTAFLVGSFVIYAFGVLGLMLFTDVGLSEAILTGVAPFVFGDIIKAAAAGLVLPGAWKLLGGRRG